MEKTGDLSQHPMERLISSSQCLKSVTDTELAVSIARLVNQEDLRSM
jgi:hypothetical protein